MNTCLRNICRASLPLVLVAVSWGVRSAVAGGIGAPQLDAFLTQFGTGVQGMGATVGIVGLAGYATSVLDNPFSTLLSGSVNLFTKLGIYGGGTTILPALGLTGGATL